MTEPDHCRTRLLSDEPASEDTFGGPHERLAATIADLIKKEDGGKAIGLEGGWGAGKSTVVQLVTRRLEEGGPNSTSVIVFDVWAHQGDPLRRTFLEKLIRHLQGDRWVSCETWDKRVEHLAKRRREEIHRIIPQLTKPGRDFALSLLAIPIGSAIVTAGAALLAAEHASVGIAIALLTVGLLAVLSPFGALAKALQIPRWLHRRGGDTGVTDLGRSGALPALVTGQSTTESRTQVTETPDPTSVEFETTFRDLCDEALEDDGRRLVLAIDNLDRVAPENALAVWATLQTFLQYSEHERPAWFRRLWVLVPFDRDGILRLWGGGDANGHAQAVAESFLDKTFQIRFRIPPPAISNWRGYLSAALAEALPDHSEEDFHGVYRAFALRKGLEDAKPRPRDLKLFVNEIGAVHRQWQHANGLTLSALACFVLLQRDEVAGTAIHSVAEDSHALFAEAVLGEGWRDTLAVLYYNAPIRLAREMVLRDPIETALVSADGEALRTLEAAHGDGFWAVFEDTVPAGAEDWRYVRPRDLAQAATALYTSELFLHGASPIRQEAVSVLSQARAAAADVDAWQPFTEDTASGLVALCRVAGTEASFIGQLLSAVTQADVQQGRRDPLGAEVSPFRWISAALVLLRGLDELGVAPVLQVPLSADQWLEASPQFQSDDWDERLWQRLDLREAEEIDIALSLRSTPEQIDSDTVAQLEVTLRTKAATSLTSTANQMVGNVQNAGWAGAQQSALVMRGLTACDSAGLIDNESRQRLATEGYLLHHLYHAISERHAEAAARYAFAYLQTIPNAGDPNMHVGNSHAGHELLRDLLRNPDSVAGALDRFVGIVSQDGGIRELARIMDSEPPEPTLLNAAFRDLMESDPAAQTPKFLTEHWRKIQANLIDAADEEAGSAFQTFVRDLPSLADVPPLVVARKFVPEDAALYMAVLRVGGDEGFATWCAAGLQSLEKESWVRSLSENGTIVSLLLELKRHVETIEMGTAYLDGLTSHAQSTVHSDDDSGVGDSLPTLIALLGAGNRDLLTRSTYEALEDARGEATKLFFALHGALIAEGDFLLAQPRFVYRVCTPLLVQRNAPGLRWLSEVFRAQPDLLSQHSDQSAVADFRSRVRDALPAVDEDEENSDAIRAIADALGIEPEQDSENDPVEGKESTSDA